MIGLDCGADVGRSLLAAAELEVFNFSEEKVYLRPN